MLESVTGRVRSTIRFVAARHGGFRHGEASARAKQLDAIWAAQWPGMAPVGTSEIHNQRALFADRWVRFHSLPDGKRYARDADETREVLERHFAVLTALQSNRDGELLVIGEDWGSQDLHGGWTKRFLPGAWPWRRWHDASDPDLPDSYFWVSTAKSVRDLGPLLERVANWQAGVWIADRELLWMYHPYDGGADVYARTTQQRDELARTYSPWLSDRADGL